MQRLFVVLPLIVVVGCATAEEDPGFSLDAGSSEDKDTGAADTAVVTEDSGVATDTTVADTAVADTAVADTAVTDTFVADTFVADTFVADTFVADTFVADTFVADTFVADTFVADTFVADTGTGETGSCSGTIVDWNWNSGTGPVAALVKSSATSQWAVGPATAAGPKDGQNWLATNPNGYYVDSMREWVRLPTLDLSAWASCKVKITVDVWRYAEGLSTRVDGGNLQYTTSDPATATDWKVVDGGSMAYDGPTTASSCGTTCFVYGQKLWAGRAAPYAKTGVFTSAAPMGSQLSLRFTFFSDGSLASYDGLYVKSLRVEAVP